MPDIATHALAANTALVVGYAIGGGDSIAAAPAAAFIIGSVAPDMGMVGYIIVERYRRRRSSSSFAVNPKRWKKRLFTFLDKQTYYGSGYKFMHSLLCLVAIILPVLYFLFGPTIMLAYAFGHLLHLAMDYPLHEESWLLWPLKKHPRIVTTPEWNWWNMFPWARDNAYTINTVGIATNAALSYVLIFGSPV
jgi:membrane-bound metal-dependent hydrolase YbcI (DUF457 family)